MNSEKYTKYLKYSYITACAVVLAYFSPSILRLLLPFILAFVIAAPFHKIVEFLASKLHIHRGISSAVIFTLIIAAVGVIVGYIVYYLYTQIRSFMYVLPDMIRQFQETFIELYEKYREYLPSVAEFMDKVIEKSQISIDSYTPQLTNSAIDYATSFAASLPSALFFVLIFLLSVFFFIKDYNSIMNFFREAIPERALSVLRYLKNTAWSGFVGYIKSQIILSSVTALLVAVTFWFLDIEYAIVWAIIIGIVDALPVLGSGIILIPYAIIALLVRESFLFPLAIIILQAVIFIVRQVLSPRIMSSQLGLHPIITLISFYVGNEIMGILGMVIFPILALLLVSIYKSYKSAGSWENVIKGSDDK